MEQTEITWVSGGLLVAEPACGPLMALRDRLFDLHAQLNGSEELTATGFRRVADQLAALRTELAEARAARGQEGAAAVAGLDELERASTETLSHLNLWLAAYDQADQGLPE